MELRTTFAAALALLGGLAQAQTYNGIKVTYGPLSASELGPAPVSTGDTGRISAVACSKQNANKLYIAGADGGVWLSTNAGTSWTYTTPFLKTSAMGALTVDPANDAIVYAGTGEANFANHSRPGVGIYKSTDSGSTWTLLGESTFSGRTISRIAIDPSNTQTLYVACATAGGFPEITAAKGHPQRNGPVGIFKSTNGGSTWTQLLAGLPNQIATDIVLDPANSQIVYAAIGRIFGSSSNGIYKSTNGGVTWTKLSGGLPTSSVGRISLGISSTSRIYTLIARACDAGGNNGDTLGAYRSNDGGTSWTALGVGSMQATYGWYLNVVKVKPSNPSVVMFGGYSCLRTTDQGSSFATVTPPHVDLHAFDYDTSGRLWCGDDGGIQVSSNDGTSWTYKTTGLGTIQFYAGMSVGPNSPATIFGGQQDNGSAFRTSAGTWIDAIGGDGGWTGIDPTNAAKLFGEYQGSGTLYRSTNSGSTFSLIGSGINTADRNAFHSPFVIDPTNPNRILYGTYRVYRSTNGGTSFSAISADVTSGSGSIRGMFMAPSNPQRVYIVTNDGLVRMSSDGGVTFSTILTGQPGWQRVMREIFIDPKNDQHIWVARSGYGTNRVLESTNAGASFTAIGSTLPDIPINTVWADTRVSPPAVFAGADDGLYRTTNSGATWVKLPMHTACVIDMGFDAPTERLIVGTQGRGCWTVSLKLIPVK